MVLRGALQQGHRARVVARATIRCRRIVAIEFATCRSGRTGGASGWTILGNARRRELIGGICRQLRGKASPARRSGRHRRRCTRWRDGGSRASRVPRSVQGRVPVSAPGNRARSASAVWPDRPGDRRACPAGRWPANTWRARPRPRAIRSAAIPHPAARPATRRDGPPAPEPGQSARSALPRFPRARKSSASLPPAGRAQAP